MKALITGITGQDSSYLAELLLSKDYEVWGLIRRSSTFNRQRIDTIYTNRKNKGRFKLLYGDMTDFASLAYVLKQSKPDEIYNLAAQSHVQVSFDTPIYTGQVDAMGVLNLLEAVRILGIKTKIYQASTSELFSGDPKELPQSEKTPFNPKSPYGVAKLYAFNICKIYRESYGMFISNGILFNHESERRGENFVTRKITIGLSKILAGMENKIRLGNIKAKRDWGYAPDFVEGMWLMLQQNKPDDFILATGETHTVEEFLKGAFLLKGLNYKEYLEIDKDQFRPNEVKELRGDASKARKILKWQPKVKFSELVRLMVENDCNEISSF